MERAVFKTKQQKSTIMTKRIFMDYQSTTPMDPRVLESMMPYFTEKFGNCHSTDHEFGWEAIDAVEESRAKIARLINCNPKEIIFTSGATESNNTAIKGVVDFYKKNHNHVIISTIEHKCVINTARYLLGKKDIELSYISVKKNGIIDLNELKKLITKKTLLVSIIMISNEIGTIQPIAEIGKMCKEAGVLFHTDAAQAFGKIPIDVNEMNIDLMSISAHKIYGPKGIGALYVRSKPKIRITPLLHGGRQEKGMRSGTLPVPLVVGFGAAAEIAEKEMKEEHNKLSFLFNRFYNQIMQKIPCVLLNGDKKERFPGNINFSFTGVEAESLMGAINNVAVSAGSACTSDSLEPSYVLRAIKVDENLIHTSLRFGMGRFTTKEDVDYVVELLEKAVEKLRSISPVWEELLEKNLINQFSEEQS